MSRIFIERPIFAWVIAILIMLIGAGAITQMSIAQYPDVAPTQINIRASYPGASAQTVQNSVTQIIEQQLTGIDGLLYFTSNSTSQGQVTISAIFSKSTNPDVAQMQVQNAVQGGISRLPLQVQQQGIRVTKSNPDILMVVALYDETDRRTNFDVADWLTSNLQDQLGRVPGVGDVSVFGGEPIR
jgi:multidrug efflux pump